MTRVWNTPIFAIALVYFIVDGVFSYVTQPITIWLARLRLFERVRFWVTSLPPYPSFALFAVPVIILAAEVLKLTVVERLFQLNKDKLLSIPAFAWGYRYWRAMMEIVESLEVWKAARRIAVRAGDVWRAIFHRPRGARSEPRAHGTRIVRSN
jgi:hypothetical protein